MTHFYFSEGNNEETPASMPLMEFTEILCPYCSEAQSLNIELTVAHQSYIEDCQICCQPIALDIEIDYESQQVHVYAKQENE